MDMEVSMDTEAGKCSRITRDPQFSHVVTPHMLENGNLEVPQKLVEEHGMDSSSTNRKVNLYESKVLKIDLEDSDDDGSVEILDKLPQSNREVSLSNQASKRPSSSSARDIVIQRARAFQIANPNKPTFIFTIQPSYRGYLYIPAGPERNYFYGRSDKSIRLTGPDGRSWFMKYSLFGSQLRQVRITSGWRELLGAYNLQDGDTCVFELIDTTTMIFNMIIFHINEEEVARKDPTALERAKALKCKKPSFTVVIKFNILSLYYLYTLRVPGDHASRYLSDHHEKEVFLQITAGKTWPVSCTVNGSVVRFSLGWKDFVLENDLQDDDACVFELLSQAPNHYLVTIFRAAESGKTN